MPLPTGADQHVNALLTNMAVMFGNKVDAFVAPQVFPVIPSDKQTGKFATYDRGDFLRDEAQLRAPGDESAGGGYRVTTNSTFSCDEWGFHKDVPDQHRINADAPFNPDRDAVKWLTQKRLIKEEVLWGTEFFTTGVWGTDVTGGTNFDYWNDAASDPIDIIDGYAETIESDTGLYPNTLVINRRGWRALKNHPDIVDRVKHTSKESVTRETVARLIFPDDPSGRILVARAVKNSAAEGATIDTDYIFGNHALLCYATSTPSVEEPSAGYTFRWSGLEGAQEGVAVSTLRIDTKRVDRHEIDFAVDQKVVASVLGVFMSGVVS